MKQDLAAIIMHPTRQRIVQYLLLHEKGTAGEIGQALSDVPRPTLYRHLRLLLEAELLQIAEEKTVRGAVERTFALVKEPLPNCSQGQVSLLIQNTLLSLAGSFARYFQQPQADPQKDLLSVSSATLLLSDEELMALFGKIAAAYNEVIANTPRPDRKPRCLTIISAPSGSEEKGE